jgi:DNA-binding GntR family transcriptional regulator
VQAVATPGGTTADGVPSERNHIRRRQLSEEAAAFMRESIMSGRLRGAEYIRIGQMAEELGLSATPVREALLLLRAEGFVELDPNKGFRVVPVTRRDVNDIFELHAYVAGELAGRAATRVTDETLEALSRRQQLLADASAAGDWDDVEDLNNQIHRLINTAADAPKLFNFVRMLNHYIPRRFFGSIAGWPEASLNDHAAILEALKRRDPRSAEEAMKRHMTNAGELLAANLDVAGAEADPLDRER